MRDFQRVAPLIDAFVTEARNAPKEWDGKLTSHSFKQFKNAIKLPEDQVLADDLLQRIGMLVEFHFPQLDSEVDKLFNANQQTVALLTKDAPPTFDEVKVISADVINLTTVMRKRIRDERAVLAKTFKGKLFRAWFDD